MKKHVGLILLIVLFSVPACGPLKVHKMEQIGVKNHTLVIYFSKKVKHPFLLSIDNKSVPVVSPATGRLLQIHNLSTGEHLISIVSNWYIFSEPVRTVTYAPAKNKTAIVFSVLKYSESTRPIQEKNRPGILKRVLNTLLFWRGKETTGEQKIDIEKVYGEFTG